jgi:hypothetical protein
MEESLALQSNDSGKQSRGVQMIFNEHLDHLSGGGDTFVNRTENDLFGMKANDAKK